MMFVGSDGNKGKGINPLVSGVQARGFIPLRESASGIPAGGFISLRKSTNVKSSWRTFLFALALLALSAFQAFAAAPKWIFSFDELSQIGKSRDYPLDGSYLLYQDIDASPSRDLNGGAGFEPIGTYERPFTGSFDGQGFHVRGLYINRPQAPYVGLFGHIGAEARVSGVGVADADVTGHFAVGALAGGSDGAVVGCYSLGVVRAERAESNAGGLVGVNGGMVSGSYSAAQVFGTRHVGGLVGLLVRVVDGAVSESYASGEVSGAERVGGLVGYIFGGEISNCYSRGYVRATKSGGGLVGDAYGAGGYRSVGTVSVGASSGVEVGPASVIGSFWDVGASGQFASAGGEGKSSAEMKQRGTYAGWNFGSRWVQSTATQYPILRDVPVNAVTYTLVNGFYLDIEGYDLFDNWPVTTFTLMMKEGVAGPRVTAYPECGYRFAGWSDGLTELSRSDIAADGAVFTAEFAPDTLTIEYAAGAGGSLRVDAQERESYSITALIGTPIPQITAVPNEGFVFARWSDGGRDAVRNDVVTGCSWVRLTAMFDTLRVVTVDTVRISSFEDLSKIGNDPAYPMNGYYVMTGDIDASASQRMGLGFLPIGAKDGVQGGEQFTGTFDGRGYTIGGLSIRNVTRQAVGLFVGIGYEGTVMMLNIIADTISGRSGVGGLAGSNGGTVINCAVTARVVMSANGSAGVFVGSNTGVIRNCYAKGQLAGAGMAGGFAGVNGGAITESYSAANVNVTGGSAGGFTGSNTGQIRQCFATGDVRGAGDNVGGLTGENLSSGAITESYSTGAVANGASYSSTTGGLVGSNRGQATASGSFWNTATSGQSRSAAGTGLSGDAMKQQNSYTDWDFVSVWAMDPNKNGGYPYLRGTDALFQGKRPEPLGRNSAVSALSPRITVSGRVLTVAAPKNSNLRVSVFDLRGKAVARRNANAAAGIAKISLSALPAGKYIAEVRDRESGKTVVKSSFIVRN